MRARAHRALGGPTALALVATAFLAVGMSYIHPAAPWLTVGLLALVAAIGTASTRRPR